MRDVRGVFLSYAADKNVAKYLSNEPHSNVFETEFMISEFLRNYNNLNYYNWLITSLYDDVVLGTISLHEIDVANEKAELGIIISPKYQNNGYASEVVSAVIDFAFNKLNIHRIEVKIMENNVPSNSLFKKLNFKYEGVIHSLIKKNNYFYNVNLYYLLNE